MELLLRNMKKWIEKLRVRVKIGLLQKTTLLGKAGILSRVLRLQVPGECPNGPLVIFSRIVPVFKSDDETDPNNYRPTSLLSNFNKICERLMYI